MTVKRETEVLDGTASRGHFVHRKSHMGWSRNTSRLPRTELLATETGTVLTFRHRASCILGQAFHYSPENAFYIFNQQIYFIILYLLDLLDGASLI